MSLSETYLSVKSLLANNLTAKGIASNATEGLTTLSNKVLDIPVKPYYAVDIQGNLTDDYIEDTTIETRIFGQEDENGNVDASITDLWTPTNNIILTPVEYNQQQGGKISVTGINHTILKESFSLNDNYILEFDFQTKWEVLSASGRYYITFGQNGHYQFGVDIGELIFQNVSTSENITSHLSFLYNQDVHHCQMIRNDNAINIILDNRYMIGSFDMTNEPNIIGAAKWGRDETDHSIDIFNVRLYVKKSDKTFEYLIHDINDYILLQGDVNNSQIQFINNAIELTGDARYLHKTAFTNLTNYTASFMWRGSTNGVNTGFIIGDSNEYWMCFINKDGIISILDNNQNVIVEGSTLRIYQNTPKFVQIIRNNNHWIIDVDHGTFHCEFDKNTDNHLGLVSSTEQRYGVAKLEKFKIINGTVWGEPI